MPNNRRPDNRTCKNTVRGELVSRRDFLQKSSSALLVAGGGSHLISSTTMAGTGPVGQPVSDANGAVESAISAPKSKCDYPDSGEDIRARYEKAQYLLQGLFTKKIAFNTTLYPHWIGDFDHFWYKQDHKKGHEYRMVSALDGHNKPAFDHLTLAKALASASGKSVDSGNLPLTDIDITLSPAEVAFRAFGKCWVYEQTTGQCREKSAHPKDWAVSPDGTKAVFVRDYNLWLRDLQNGEERALTTDGQRYFVYAGTPTVYGRQETPSLEAIWSPDSKRVFTQVIDTRNVEDAPPLVQFVPTDGTLHPKIIKLGRRVAFPKDKVVEGYHFLAIEIDSGHIQWADYPLSPVFKPPYVGYFTGHRGWWGKDSRHAYFINLERGGKTGRLLAFDTYTGEVRVLIEDHDDFHVTFIPISHTVTLIFPLPETNEVIWYSERDGWPHLYLHDLNTGKLKKRITRGNWAVRNVLRFNAKRRELFIQTAGRDSDINPWYCDICRVNIDNGEFVTIAASDHEYVVCDQRSRISSRDRVANGVSPSGRYVVTTRSRTDQVPVSLLLDRNGNEITEVETANVSGLPKNWRWPEPVMLKAADGKTDIFATVTRPSDFSPDKLYPVLDLTLEYSAAAGSFSNSHHGDDTLTATAYAELGFIVVMVTTRGSGLRDRAFNHAKDALLPNRNYNVVDCIAAIRQLAERYPYMDLNRVGVGGSTNQTTALSGMLGHPGFYKVGVARSHGGDGRVKGAFARVDDNLSNLPDHAHKLQGKLLLMHGMLDDAAPVAITFRLVDALQKANKRFDMLVLPNMGHSANSYTVMRVWDHFVTHLLGVEPPEDFALITGRDLHLQERKARES